CDLELKYVNSEKSMEWLKEKVYKLAEIFDVKNYNEIEYIKDIAYFLENNKEKVRVDVFSEPYYCLNDDWDINLMKINKTEHLDREKLDVLNNEYIGVTSKSIEYANNICAAFEGSLTNNLMDLYVKDYNGQTFYELSLQPSYKGLGIQSINPTYHKEYTNDDNILIADAFDVRFLYDVNLKLYLYYGCNNYTPVKAEPIDKIISFKSACDILEEELASNVSMEFDDVKLWYEPRGTILDATTEDGFDGAKTTKCTPKWFFISDNEEDSGLWHAINYVTVDCVTGEIEVFFPGS
ncbi:MAG: hypothetical protein K2F81_04185, partial [Ruminococcus sp.]|nr:hypothetical protein [Ruminococcus sp.]